jgi:hypothetical protein
VVTGASGATGYLLPPTGAGWDYQIGGGYEVPADAGIVSRDREDVPADGVYNVCYINAFQTQQHEVATVWDANRGLLVPKQAYANGGIPASARPSRAADARKYWAIDGAWNELILDTSTAAKRAALLKIMKPWIDACASDGFDAIESDNLDSWTRTQAAYRLDRAHNVAFAKLLTDYAHSRGLASGQKNTTDIGAAAAARIGFDFAVAEQCGQYDECGAYTAVYGLRVLVVEYSLTGLRAACADYPELAPIRRDLKLKVPGQSGYLRQTCADL